MKIELRDYQRAAVEKLKNGSILRADVGRGKSRTAIAYYYKRCGGDLDADHYVRMKNPPDLYIITVAKKRDEGEWERELLPFLLSTHAEYNGYHNKVVVDSWQNIEKYVDISGAFFLFDEQRVVGNGVWVKSFLKICKTNEWILITATPGDKWEDYIPVFVANGFYKNRSQFKREHLIYSQYCRFPNVIGYLGTRKLERLRDSILVEMGSGSLAMRHEEDIYVDYDVAAYRRVQKDRWDIFENKPFQNAGAMCYGLRHVVNASDERGEKVLDILAQHPKAIIFYNFDYELEFLKGLPYPKGTIVREWNGHNHEKLPEGEKWVYLVQYTAGSEGWNCITTDTMIFYSQNYSYRTMVQASGRIDRMDSPFRDLYFYTIRTHAPIDRAIAAALAKKKKFNAKKFIGDVIFPKAA